MKNKFFKKPFFTEYFLAPTSETFSLANIIESEQKTLDFSTIFQRIQFLQNLNFLYSFFVHFTLYTFKAFKGGVKLRTFCCERTENKGIN